MKLESVIIDGVKYDVKQRVPDKRAETSCAKCYFKQVCDQDIEWVPGELCGATSFNEYFTPSTEWHYADQHFISDAEVKAITQHINAAVSKAINEELNKTLKPVLDNLKRSSKNIL